MALPPPGTAISPTLVKRRLTPPNFAKPVRIVSSAQPISTATPIAASAF
jgi:hypothetical protein